MKLGSIQVVYCAPNRQARRCKVSYRFFQKASAMLTVAVTNLNMLYAEDNIDVGLANMDAAGEKVLKIGYRIGYWTCIVMCIFEIIKSVKDGDTNAIWGIIVKYAMAYGGLHLIKALLDLVGGLFG